MNKPHKHAELIKAWADGAEIEYSDSSHGDWVLTKHPEWSEGLQYRIKPEPKPDVVKYLALANDNKSWFEFANPVYEGYPRFHTPQIKIIRNGETGQLINAEVLK